MSATLPPDILPDMNAYITLVGGVNLMVMFRDAEVRVVKIDEY